MTAVDEKLASAVATADSILQLVHDGAPEGIRSQDPNEQIVALTYGRAFRCFRSIRDLVATRHNADDAIVLTRALLSMTLRSVWLIASDDPKEREDRFWRAIRDGMEEAAKADREVADLGIEIDLAVDQLEELEKLRARGVRRLPKDKEVADEIGISILYSGLYRGASDVTHYSLVAATAGFNLQGGDMEELAATGFEGVEIRFHEGDPERAERALFDAALVYGMFLENSDAIVKHGVGDPVKDRIQEHLDRWYRASEQAES